jgi:hypothetical protein
MLASKMGSVSDARSGEENIGVSGRLTKRDSTLLNSSSRGDVAESETSGDDDDQNESPRASFPRLLLLLDTADMEGEMRPALANLIPHYISQLPKYRTLAPDQASSEVQSSGHRHPRKNQTQWDFLQGV